MQLHFSRLLIAAGLAAAMASAAAAPAAAQGSRPEHIRGTITASDESSLTVRTREGGTVRIALPAKVRISGYAKAELDRVKKGTYIGTAAVPQADGTLHAQEVLIFPERMRGVGEGHRKWDLTADSTMTNANVDMVVDDVKGRMLSLMYKGGAKKLLVPKGTPVVTIVRAGKQDLKPGTHIFAVARKGKDGGYSAVRIGLGVDGLVPPM